MNKKYSIAQLYLRIALGLGFLLPVLDRLGLLGAPGTHDNAWGNWTNFVGYTQTLMPYLGSQLVSFMAVAATVSEIVFGVTLLVGYKIKYAAIGSFLLTLAFALSMFFFSSVRAPFTYSVFVNSAAALLLVQIPVYKWSLDALLSKKTIHFR